MNSFLITITALDLLVLIFIVVANIKIIRANRDRCKIELGSTDLPTVTRIETCSEDRCETVVLALLDRSVMHIPYGSDYVDPGAAVFNDKSLISKPDISVYGSDFSTKDIGEHIVTYVHLTTRFEMMVVKRKCIVHSKEVN